MPALVGYAAAFSAAVSAWLVRGALAIQSSAPDASKVGILPPLWELGLFVLLAACVVFLLRPSSDRLLPLFATGLCILPWLPGVRSPALLMWTGPLGALVWAGAVTASVVAGQSRLAALLAKFNSAAIWTPSRAPFVASAAACAFFAVVAYGARGAVPLGDEPHFLIITQSILKDGDIRIENNHAQHDYEAYFSGPLQPDFWRRGQNGAIYSIHAPGLPALVAPAFFLGGYPGVVVFLVLVASLGAGLLWRLAYAISGRTSSAWFAVAATASATPVAFHSFTVYPDGPAGVIVLSGVWALFRLARISPSIPLGSARSWMLHGLALAVLPWMHTRLVALAGLLAIIILLRMPRTRDGLTRAAAFVSVPVVSAVAWFGFFFVIYGTPNPAAPWSSLVSSWRFIPGGLSGILFDQQFGALPYAPILLVGVVGWFVALGGRRRLALELALIAVPYMILTTQLWIWWGGGSAPARFWTPLFWLGGVPAAVAWSHAKTRATRGSAIGLLLVSALTTLGLAYAFGGRLAYNVRDGYAQWFDWLSPLTDLPLGLPSFFRLIERQSIYDLQILVVVAGVVAAFVALRWLDRRVRGTGAFALLMLSFYALAGMLVVTILWQANGSTGVRVTTAQLRLLDAARADGRIGVTYRGAFLRFSHSDVMLRDLRIGSPPRLTAGTEPAALVLPGWFPAGTYTLKAELPTDTPSSYDVRVLRAGAPILQATAPAAAPQLALTVTLPVDAPALILRGRGLRSAFLAPTHVATPRERFSVERATSARRYGSTIAWLMDRNAFDDPDGIWTAGRGAQTRLLLQPDAGPMVRLLVRNGPVANEATLSTEGGNWSWTMTFGPEEERETQVPVDPARGAVLLRVVSHGGFRPSEVDPGSHDTRLLGVWMSPR
jgi:hypothetical protein